MNRLTLTYKGNEIISSIFNFKAYRAIAGVLDGEVAEGLLDEAAMAGLIAMFDGTAITSEVLMKCTRSASPNASAFSRASARASALMSIAAMRALGTSLAIASAMHPLPVP